MKREELAEVIRQERLAKAQRPEDKDKELPKVAERRGHLGRKITIKVGRSRRGRRR